MKARKTIKVADLKTEVNNMLANSVDDMTDGRIAVSVLLETVLLQTGNYHGFRYLPGVMDFSVNPPKSVGDETRRYYY